MFSGARKPRVAHVVDACFPRTLTFVYDFVVGCRRFESWCLTKEIVNTDEFPFDRIELTTIQRQGKRPWDVVDRLLERVSRDHRLPFYRALARIRPAVVHAHFGPLGSEVLVPCRRFNLPLLTSFYGYDASSLPQVPGEKAPLLRLFELGTAFTAEGPVMRERLKRLGCPEEKIFLLPITIHCENYRYRPRSMQPGETFRILFVGRFVPKKGLPVLLRALSAAGPRLGPYELRIIGGPEIDEMAQLADELGIRAQVSFLGFQSRATMLQEMESAHVLAMPSHTAPDGDTEGGAPTVGLEAQACGLPIVSTTHADIPYIVAPRGQTYLAQEGSVEDFAEKLLALRAASDQWPALGEAGREHIQKQHGAANFDLLENIYAEIIKKHRSRRRRAVQAGSRC